MIRVLLADANPRLLEAMTLSLEIRDCQVTPVTSGQQLLDRLQAGEPLPAIIVSDNALPDMAIDHLLARLRGRPDWAAIPVLFLVAFNSPALKDLKRLLAPQDYLIKPVQADELFATLQRKVASGRVKEK